MAQLNTQAAINNINSAREDLMTAADQLEGADADTLRSIVDDLDEFGWMKSRNKRRNANAVT